MMATLKDVAAYFGIPLAQFRGEWAALTDEDKAAIRRGIGDGTLTY